MAQNCPPEYVTSIDFTIKTESQDGKRVHDTGTLPSEVTPTEVSNIVLTNLAEDPLGSNYFGILLNKEYNSEEEAFGKIEYSYVP